MRFLCTAAILALAVFLTQTQSALGYGKSACGFMNVAEAAYSMHESEAAMSAGTGTVCIYRYPIKNLRGVSVTGREARAWTQELKKEIHITLYTPSNIGKFARGQYSSVQQAAQDSANFYNLGPCGTYLAKDVGASLGEKLYLQGLSGLKWSNLNRATCYRPIMVAMFLIVVKGDDAVVISAITSQRPNQQQDAPSQMTAAKYVALRI